MGAEPVTTTTTTHPAAVPVPVLLVPFPAQGHITPMLQLAAALAAHGGLAPTVAVPDFIHRRIAAAACGGGGGGGVALASIPSGIVVVQDTAAAAAAGAGGGDDDTTPEFGDIVRSMEHHMPLHLERVLLASSPPFACVVVDVLASWAVPVAARRGVPAAGFWPAMLACYRVVAAIPELLEKGLISESGTPIPPALSPDDSDDEPQQVNLDVGRTTIRGLDILPPQVELRVEELPWLVGDSATQRSRFAFWLLTLHRARGFRWVLVNSFPAEAEAVAAAAGIDDDNDDAHRLVPRQGPRVLPVGPALLPGAGGTKQQQQQCGNGNGNVNNKSSSNINSPGSMWRADATCVGWLDAQRAGSVVYVSFGSWVGSIGADKVRELALGLEATGRPFLWALKRDASWRAGLPEGFAGRVAAGGGRGKLVDWAPQRDVLRHPAVGCYLTHCGWNSTLEAIQHGVRLLCYPVSGDQFINCAYITGVWRIGLRLAGGGGTLTRGDVAAGVARVMDDGDEGRRLQENVWALRDRVVTAEATREACRNVGAFVDEITRDHPALPQVQLYGGADGREFSGRSSSGDAGDDASALLTEDAQPTGVLPADGRKLIWSGHVAIYS